MKTLGICDDVPEYAKRLKKRLISKNEFPFEIVVYDSLEELINEGKDCELDIIVIRDNILKNSIEEILDFSNGKLLIALADENVCEEDLDKIPYLYRYQPARIIHNRILEIVSENLSDINGIYSNSVSDNTTFIGIYSPTEKIRQKEFAFYLSKYISENKKVLYVDLSLFPVKLSEEIFDEKQKNIADLLFAASGSRGNFCLKMDSMKIREDKLDYIKGVEDFIDILGVEQKDWEELFNQIEKSSKYDMVILNIDESIQGFLSVLNQCKYIYSIYDNDEYSLEILSKYKEAVNRNNEEIIKKTEFILLPEDITTNKNKNIRRRKFQQFVKKINVEC